MYMSFHTPLSRVRSSLVADTDDDNDNEYGEDEQDQGGEESQAVVGIGEE